MVLKLSLFERIGYFLADIRSLWRVMRNPERPSRIVEVVTQTTSEKGGYKFIPLTIEDIIHRLDLAEKVCKAQDYIQAADRGAQEAHADAMMSEAFRDWVYLATQEARY